MVKLSIENSGAWADLNIHPLIIAGPCSAETEEQVLNSAKEIAKIPQVNLFRAGIWKPRTRPGSFEGVGEEGLKWLQKVKEETGLKTTTEVASARHVEACLKHDVDVLWIGARTTVNPFSVQEVADALKGVDIPVMVKNPINPDLALWIGALERLNKVGISKLIAIHRGFSSFEKSAFRNAPMWDLPIELKTKIPELPIICDPSHIAGNRELLSFISQKAFDLDMHGVMIESHIHPKTAWSDGHQQVTPANLKKLLDELIIREPVSEDQKFRDQLADLRQQIDELDEDIIHKLAARMQIAEKIGEYKRDNNVTILQVNRWDEIIRKRKSMGNAMGLSDEFLEGLLKLVHKESIRKQTEIMNKKEQV